MAMNGGSRKDEGPVSSESYVARPHWLMRSDPGSSVHTPTSQEQSHPDLSRGGQHGTSARGPGRPAMGLGVRPPARSLQRCRPSHQLPSHGCPVREGNNS